LVEDENKMKSLRREGRRP